MARIKWDIEWICENFNSYDTLQKLNTEYNKTHGTDIGYRTFKGVCQRNGMYKSNLSEEQELFLREVYPMYGVKKTTELFNEKFGTNKTCEKIRGLVSNRKLTIQDHDTYCKLRCKSAKMEVGEISKGWGQNYVKLPNGKFQLASRYIWEQKYGKLSRI